MFGPQQTLNLHLLDIPPAHEKLQGVKMELEDGAYSLVKNVIVTTEVVVAVKDADYVIMVGAFPRKKGMERRELLEKNAGIFGEMAREGLKSGVAKEGVKVLVVGNPVNTNAWILKKIMGSAGRKVGVSGLTRLDHNRVVGSLARKFDVHIGDVEGVCIWGNHSKTQYPDIVRVKVNGGQGVSEEGMIVEKLGGLAFLEEEFIPMIQGRGGAVIAARGLSSAMSAANAIVDHMRDWICGSEGRVVSMAVPADGSYGVEDIFFSYPVVCKEGGEYEIQRDIELDDFSKKYIMDSAKELYAERNDAFNILEKSKIANGNL